jgi:hypothetical protein
VAGDSMTANEKIAAGRSRKTVVFQSRSRVAH